MTAISKEAELDVATKTALGDELYQALRERRTVPPLTERLAGISIDDGAYFKGSIDISRPEPKVTTKAIKSEAKAG